MNELLHDLHPLSALVAAVATFVLLTVLFALVQGWTWDRMKEEPEPWYSRGEDPPFPDDPPERFDSYLYEQRRN